ncbi:MAG: DUF2905 domain-containing protein [Candidatus Omnitrophica bacterium]|nr:DUF2905 domain-containing protein [Candidatus Omnitrophota bacterium]MDD5237405.1 DUF2905 domain-containing protein [Candidatus Omnitrophota bacterium]
MQIAKALIILGIIFIIFGVFVTLFHRIPFLGKLPGDILVHKKNFTFYFPLVTSILVSILLSLILWLWSRR